MIKKSVIVSQQTEVLWFINLLLSNAALRVFVVVFAFVYLVFSQSESVKSESVWVFKMYFMLRKHLLVYFGQMKKCSSK